MMTTITQRRCRNCLLLEDVENHLTLDEDSLCSLCRRKLHERAQKNWEERRQLLEQIIAQHRGATPYDAVIMMSGGKDSAYLAYVLKKKLGLNLLGITNDIHFEYQETFDNARSVCDRLSIPLVINRPPAERMKKFFRYLFLTRELREKGGGHICNYCGRFMIRTAADYAAAHNIPLLFAGHSPEQIEGMGQSYETEQRGKLRKSLLNQRIQQQVQTAVQLLPENITEIRPMFPETLFPDSVTGVFYYQYVPYEPEKMMELIKRELDWRPVRKLSETYIFSGCRLAALWMKIASLNNTSNYMDLELSAQVRNGILSRKIVKDFYEHSCDNDEDIQKLLGELELGSIENLL